MIISLWQNSLEFYFMGTVKKHIPIRIYSDSEPNIDSADSLKKCKTKNNESSNRPIKKLYMYWNNHIQWMDRDSTHYR